MRVIALTAENFKRLKAVHIEPNGGLVQISGRNAAGKSSVLDAVWAALGGKDAAPAKPVREGATSARIVLDLGDLVVTRKFSGERSTLVVESKDGLKHPSPQAVLDRLVGRLSFDPLEFVRLDGKKQAATLRELVGLDVGSIEDERRALFDRRTDVNREVKALQAQLEAMPPVAAPDAEVSVADLVKQHRVACEEIAARDRAQRRMEDLARAADSAKETVVYVERQLAEARERLAAAEKMRDEYRASLAAAPTAAVDPDAIAAQMDSAERVNAGVRAKKARAAKAAELARRETAAGELTEKIKALDELKQAMLSAATFPVPGLSVDGDVVTMNGLPFDQASSAEQLRVCLAMGAALNPTLRVVLVRDGSLLDDNGLRLVAEWAEENEMQVLLERVGDGGSAGIVIEDGEVAADLQASDFSARGEVVA